MAVRIDTEDFLFAIKSRLEYIGLGNFSTDISRLANQHGYSVTFYESKNIPIHELHRNPAPQYIFENILLPLEESIMDSGLILALKESHDKEIQTLKEQIERLEKQNMELSEAFTNGLEMLDENNSEE